MVYFAFDLIWLNGHDLSDVPLLRRKELLKALLQKADERIRYVDHVKGEGRFALEKARKSGMEGVMAKRAKSTYEVGSRSKNWLKIKFSESQEVVICGYLASGPNLRSLLCCVNRGGDLIYSGKVGIGFSEAQGKAIVKVLKKHARKTPPEVKNLPDDDNVHWVTPNEVCEVRFTEWTAAGSMRHPVFLGLRSDKTASDIVREVKIAPPPVDLPFTLSNPDKLFWKEEGITKKDVFDYYSTVADCILPYLRNRPMSLYRTPDGADDDGFFQKDVSETAPDWLETTLVKSSDRNIEYALCQDRKALLYLVNLGCIEMNPWNATVDGPEHPDLLVFDLDPLDISYSEVIRVALKLKKVLVDLEIPSFPKTTGSKGFHVFVPIVPNLTHKQVQNFAKKIMGHLHRLLPKITSLERSPQKRKGKVYLDYLQNGRGKTMASVYSLRPRAWSAVSVPLKWGEVIEDLDPKKFTIRATLARLEAVGDVWKDMSLAPIDLKKRFDQ